MGGSDRVGTGRRALGSVGVFLPNPPGAGVPSAEVQRDAVRRLERAGYQAVWNNEGVGGKDGLVQLGVLLAATERITFGTAIANIWARPPQTAHGAAALLADAYPGRFVLGLGVGYPFQAAQIGRDYGHPLATIRDYFGQMTAEQPMAQVPELSYPRILAANGPKMLALAGEIADGAMPVFVPPEYTANARRVLGPDKILVVGLSAAVDDDPDRARADARRFVSEVLARPGSPYALNLTRLGYSPAWPPWSASPRRSRSEPFPGDPPAPRGREHDPAEDLAGGHLLVSQHGLANRGIRATSPATGPARPYIGPHACSLSRADRPCRVAFGGVPALPRLLPRPPGRQAPRAAGPRAAGHSAAVRLDTGGAAQAPHLRRAALAGMGVRGSPRARPLG